MPHVDCAVTRGPSSRHTQLILIHLLVPFGMSYGKQPRQGTLGTDVWLRVAPPPTVATNLMPGVDAGAAVGIKTPLPAAHSSPGATHHKQPGTGTHPSPSSATSSRDPGPARDTPTLSGPDS